MRCPKFPEKTWFDRYDAAEKVASARGMRVYRCEACGMFHLTTRRAEAHVEKHRVMRALHELRRKNVTGPLRDAAEAKARDLGVG